MAFVSLPHPTPNADYAATALRVRMFGVPTITWNEAALTVRRRQIRALLYRLAVDLEPVSRAELCYLFWADIPDSAARRNLTHLLTLTRHALPNPDVLQTTPDQVGLDVEQTWSDTAAFQQLLRLAEHPQRLDALECAVDLLNGRFLEGFFLPNSAEFEAWAEQERTRWEQRTLTALATACEQLSAAGAYQEALTTAQRYLVIDETAEEMHRQVMKLYAELGDQAAAVRHFMQCSDILQRELGVAPAPATVALYEQVRSHQYPAAAAASAAAARAPSRAVSPRREYGQTLPELLTPIIGRKHEIAKLCDLLKTPALRMITLSGLGGIGKTKLAIAAANQLAGYFHDGTVFVDLAPLRQADKVLWAIAHALGISETADEHLIDVLQAQLSERKLLLVLDNFEHLISAGPLLCTLLKRVPGLKVLVTSRRVLRVSGEYVFSLQPLALPDPAALPTLADAVAIPAIRLFIDRARAQLPTFRVSQESIPVIADLCVRLDGVPLAIELAAARIKVLSPHKLLARLDQRFALLVGGKRDLPPRQQTLRQTIDWSYHLLEPDEQRLLEQLSVFAQGWTLEAAEAVAAAAKTVQLDVIDGLNTLLDNHLVQRSVGEASEPRFSMLETIREYAYERLQERGLSAATHRAHALYYLTVAKQPQEATAAPDRHRWVQRMHAELHNIRAALQWCLHADPLLAADYGQTMGQWWANYGMWSEGLSWVQQIADVVADAAAAVQAPIYEAWGALLDRKGRHIEAAALYKRALALYELGGQTRKVGELLVWLAWAALASGQYDQTTSYLDQALSLDFVSSDPAFRVTVLQRRGTAALAQNHLAQARADLAAALELVRQLPDDQLLPTVLVGLGTVALLAGDYDEAQRLLSEGLVYRQRYYRSTWGIAHAQYLLGVCALLRNDLEAAHSYTRATLAYWLAEEQGLKLSTTLDAWAVLQALRGQPDAGACLFSVASHYRQQIDMVLKADADTIIYGRLDSLIRATLSAEQFAAAWDAGRDLDIWVVAQRILNETGTKEYALGQARSRS